MTEPFRIRSARLPDDKAAILNFIIGLQHFEKTIEPDRRLDPNVAEESFAVVSERVARRNGCMLIAENAHGDALGWAAAYESANEIYVLPDERTYGYIAELYVDTASRGLGIGKALIAACETWGKERRLKVMIIGVLAGNSRADWVYQSAGFEHYATELRKYLR